MAAKCSSSSVLVVFALLLNALYAAAQSPLIKGAVIPLKTGTISSRTTWYSTHTLATGDTWYVTDAVTTADCTTGSGTALAPCIYDGTTWIPFGSGASGGILDDGSVTLAKIDSAILGSGTTGELVTYGSVVAIDTAAQTIDDPSDSIDCGSVQSISIARVTVSGGDITLTSDPQIVFSGTNHLCGIYNDGTSNTVTLVDGTGVDDRNGQATKIWPGHIEWFFWTSANEWKHIANPFSACTVTFPGNVPTLDCGSTTFTVQTLVASGTITGLLPTGTITGNTTLTAAQMAGQEYWVTATADITLPTFAAGLNACFVANGAFTITLDPPSSSGLSFWNLADDGAQETVDTAIDSPGTAGAKVCLVAVTVSATNKWWVQGRVGSWVNGGAD